MIGFSVSVLCTGLLSTDVDIRLDFNVSTVTSTGASSNRPLSFTIRRKKSCLRGIICRSIITAFILLLFCLPLAVYDVTNCFRSDARLYRCSNSYFVTIEFLFDREYFQSISFSNNDFFRVRTALETSPLLCLHFLCRVAEIWVLSSSKQGDLYDNLQ